MENITRQRWEEDITKCPICGKDFLVMYRPDYVYKTKDSKGRVFCITVLIHVLRKIKIKLRM